MSYPRDQSVFYKVTSPLMLSKRLGTPLPEIIKLCKATENYKRWIDKGSGRAIQEPMQRLNVIHRRVAALLSRIETPEYLHSAIKGRSYISNAKQHVARTKCVKVDIRKFYPSVRAQAVHHFFFDRMSCAEDVAGILTKLLTVDGHLPTGSSSSPILSYFAYEDMFQELAELAALRECTMTVYVDDVVFTGSGATRSMLYEARKIIGRYRLHAHKTKVFRSGQPRIITGVAVTEGGFRLPNKRQKAITEDYKKFESLTSGFEKLVVARRLTGRLFEASQIDILWRERAISMAAERDALETFVRRA